MVDAAEQNTFTARIRGDTSGLFEAVRAGKLQLQDAIKKVDEQERRITDLRRRATALRRTVAGTGVGVSQFLGGSLLQGSAGLLAAQGFQGITTNFINSAGLEESVAGRFAAAQAGVGASIATGFAFGGPIGALTASISGAIQQITFLFGEQSRMKQEIERTRMEFEKVRERVDKAVFDLFEAREELEAKLRKEISDKLEEQEFDLERNPLKNDMFRQVYEMLPEWMA